MNTRISVNSSCEWMMQMARWSPYFRCISHSSRAWSRQIHCHRCHHWFQSWQLNSSGDKHATMQTTNRMWRKRKILIFDRCCDFISLVISIEAWAHVISNCLYGCGISRILLWKYSMPTIPREWFRMSRERNRRRSQKIHLMKSNQRWMNSYIHSV